MTTRITAIFVLVIAFISFPIQKTVDVDITIKKHEKVVVQTKATMAQKRANKALAKSYAYAGWGWRNQQWTCINKLFTAESRFDHLAKNQKGSSAFGIAQVLKEKSKDPAIQLLHAYKYIEIRYGNPCSAWSHHVRRNWY